MRSMYRTAWGKRGRSFPGPGELGSEGSASGAGKLVPSRRASPGGGREPPGEALAFGCPVSYAQRSRLEGARRQIMVLDRNLEPA
jgi:hypothetical protein